MGGGAPCDDMGSTNTSFWAVDQISTTTSAPSDTILFDWGDIAPDTVVDCVQVHWVTGHADTDANMDGFPDGVEGFGATWTFWDGMNGRAPQFNSIAVPIISIGLYNLPGELSDPNDSLVAYYTADIDLVSSFGTMNSLMFEIGDTDSDLQGAAVHNPRMDLNDGDGDGIPDLDPDEDGLADWGWSVNFHQPGTMDFDNADGDDDPVPGPDGDPFAEAIAGVAYGMPWPGHAEYNSDADAWDWVLDGPTAGETEDVFQEGHVDVNTGAIILDGPYWFGGFSCEPFQRWAGFQIVLYGPNFVDDRICYGDMNDDGMLDFVDISQFASTQPDFNGDTYFDFVDISFFVSSFAIGCHR